MREMLIQYKFVVISYFTNLHRQKPMDTWNLEFCQTKFGRIKWDASQIN